MMKAISSTYHQLPKYPTPYGMANIRGDQTMAKTVAAIACKRLSQMPKASRAIPNEDSPVDKKQNRVADQQQSKFGKNPNPDSPIESGNPDCKIEEEPKLFGIDPHHSERTFRIGSNLHPREKTLFKQFLTKNADVFAWFSTDMPGIDLEVICHKLSIEVDAKPMKQKPKRMNEESSLTIIYEVDRLLQAGFIRETFYPDWHANPVHVKKKNGKWRVCIDFTDLNEACLKDYYILPSID